MNEPAYEYIELFHWHH